MFVITDEKMKAPLKIWLPDKTHAEESCLEQAYRLGNLPFIHKWVCLMPDAHAGMGMPIGGVVATTDVIIPNAVGVDIGCGMAFAGTDIKVDEIRKVMTGNGFLIQGMVGDILRNIPVGFNRHKHAQSCITLDTARESMEKYEVNNELCGQFEAGYFQVGTLGGGNHFIELCKDDDGRLYLVVHSGSRNLGKQVAEYYQDEAVRNLKDRSEEINTLISELKRQGRETEIQTELKKLGALKVDKTLAYAEGRLFDEYLHDMAIVQHYAALNRKAIVKEIVKHMKFKVEDSFTTIHNYIETETMILRKGAISAKTGERVLIPINMRDGSLICIGKGNPDWSYSAPHGAGRLMSRSAAKQSVTLPQFKASMEGIYSSTVNKSTIDESPFAYKPMDEIIDNISDTAEIVKTIKPVYNFKAAE